MDDPCKTLEAGLAAFEPGFVFTRVQPPAQHRAAINAIDDTGASAPDAAAGRP